MSPKSVSFGIAILALTTHLSGCQTSTPSKAVAGCPLDGPVCGAVVEHCADLSAKFDKARSLAIGADIGLATLDIRYEEKQLISEDYLALQGMAYFSCAAFHKGDISHEEYVNSLFPIAALAEAVGKYLASSDEAKQIQTLMQDVVNGASTLSVNPAQAALLRDKYQKLRDSPALKSYVAGIANAAKTHDDENVLMSEQIERLRDLLADRSAVLKQVHDEAQPSPQGELWFRAFVLDRDQATQLSERRFVGIDERFRRLERVGGTSASYMPDDISGNYEVVAVESLDILDFAAGLDSEAERRLQSLCKGYAIWPYQAFVHGQSTDEPAIRKAVEGVVQRLKGCGFETPGINILEGGSSQGWIHITVITRCSLGEACVREQRG